MSTKPTRNVAHILFDGTFFNADPKDMSLVIVSRDDSKKIVQEAGATEQPEDLSPSSLGIRPVGCMTLLDALRPEIAALLDGRYAPAQGTTTCTTVTCSGSRRRGVRHKWSVESPRDGEACFTCDVTQSNNVHHFRRIQADRFQKLLAAIVDSVALGWSYGANVIASVRRPSTGDGRWLELATSDPNLRRDCDAAEGRAHEVFSRLGFGSGELDAFFAGICDIPIASLGGAGAPIAVRNEGAGFIKFKRRKSNRIARGPQISSDRMRKISEAMGLGDPVDDLALRGRLATLITEAMGEGIVHSG